MKRACTLALLMCGLLGAWGCGKSAANSPASQPEKSSTAGIYIAGDAKGIRTTVVKSQPIPDYLEIPGLVVPDPTRVVHVSPAAGGRLVEMRVRPWDRVKRGEILAVMESSDASRAVADYQKAHLDAQLKKKALDRTVDLYSHHAVSQKDMESAQADSLSAAQEEKSALDALHLLGASPDGTPNQLTVTAPRDGVVLDVGAATGELSKALDAPQPLCTIAELNSIWIEGNVYEKDLSAVKQGSAAEVTLNSYPGEKWQGRVTVISDAVDPATRTLKVRIVLPNPQLRLKPQMFATVRLVRSTSPGLLIPASAVLREGTDSYVYISASEGRFQRRSVTLGRIAGENVEVTSGLSAGDVIISEGALLLRSAQQD